MAWWKADMVTSARFWPPIAIDPVRTSTQPWSGKRAGTTMSCRIAGTDYRSRPWRSGSRNIPTCCARRFTRSREWTPRWYAKTSKRNAHIECFHRTVPESFVDDHEELLFTDLDACNHKLADWLVFDNAERPHHALGQRRPLRYPPQHQAECQRWCTHTSP